MRVRFAPVLAELPPVAVVSLLPVAPLPVPPVPVTLVPEVPEVLIDPELVCWAMTVLP